MIRVRLKEKRIHNRSAFFASVTVLVIAFMSAKMLGLSITDITQGGFFGPFIYFGSFAVFVGFPAYFIFYYLAHAGKN